MAEIERSTPMMSSLDIAEVTGKQHSHVMADIRKICQSDQQYYEKSEYSDKQGKCRPMYTISFDVVGLLNMRYGNPFLAQRCGQVYVHEKMRLETTFEQHLKVFLHALGIQLLSQYRCGKYKIDFFLPQLNVAIEFDESQHFSLNHTLKDKQREDYISRKLSCKIIRLDGNDCIERNLAKKLLNH